MSIVSRHRSSRSCGVSLLAAALLAVPFTAHATEGALGRQVTGTSVQPNAGIVSPEPIWAVNFAEIYLDGKVGGGRDVPLGKRVSADVEGKVAFTLATLLKTWDTGPGRWNFASSVTLPYVWTKVNARASGPLGRSMGESDTASNLFDLYFSPIIAGYHFSETSHMALSLNVWAPTGKYDANALANPSLNNWTFIPQVAYTHIFPQSRLQLDTVASVQFYTRNNDTDYRNAPIFGIDVMGRKTFSNGLAVGLVLGTQQQLGSDSGPTANRLNGFKGRDWALGPVITYDRKLADKRSLSLGLRWVPTISSTNRLDSSSTFMASATLVF
ncbi:SphA family protein [Achromobacter xylosoxidans]|uniref:SphA family protein n=1 Tax=Alcaligenes xylosoxydans xylosoxydans TaxID=85698 RepID=UPI0008A41438|nr:transporter [Achromobacter xylosoxidans]OFU68698.1 phenol degradation protein meta [Achromobacter xylosoxidans]